MNELTNFEVLELFASYESSMDLQLQLWLSITFAAIAASFLARESLTKLFAYFMGAIYLLATTAIASRFMIELYRIRVLVEEYDFLAQTFPPWAPYSALASFLMFALGTAGCLYCIYHFVAKS